MMRKSDHIKPVLPTRDDGLTLSEQLFDRIGQAIISGEIPAGAKISEPVLARRYGVSRGPIREALQRLQERKLVTRIPHVGARVVEMSYQVVRELFIVREALEGMAAREAALIGSPEELRAIRAMHEGYVQKLAEARTPPSYFHGSTDTDFHFLIAQASRNPTLIGLLCSDLHLLMRFYRTRVRDVVGRVPRIVIEHERIVAAIEERDADMAELHMRRHIAAARHGLEALLSERTPMQAGSALTD